MLTRLSDNTNGFAFYLCDCGQTSLRRSDSVDRGRTKSCGCIAKIDLTGARFGMLTFMHRTRDSNGLEKRALWLCDCGRTRDARISHVKRGGVRSCGCSTVRFIAEARAAKQLPATSGLKCVMRAYVKNAKLRAISFELSSVEFESLILQECHYCGQSPTERNFRTTVNRGRDLLYACSGVDRIDSSGPYSILNCVSCCSQCNYAKRDHSYTVFIEWLDRLTSHSEHFVNAAA